MTVNYTLYPNRQLSINSFNEEAHSDFLQQRRVTINNTTANTISSGDITTGVVVGPNWWDQQVTVTSGPVKTTEQIVEDKVKKMLDEKEMVLVPTKEFEAMNNTILKLKDGYFVLYEFLTGKQAETFTEALEGLTDTIKSRSLDELLLERATKNAKQELGELSSNI